jgi:nitrite reductase/ring-hydroxylating ferredoxin subunit
MTAQADLAGIDPTQPIGTITSVTVDGEAMAVIHTSAGWVLTQDRCPHASCPFSADGELADDGTLICNCHGSEFDPRTGELLQGPAQDGLTIIPLRVERNALNFGQR